MLKTNILQIYVLLFTQTSPSSSDVHTYNLLKKNIVLTSGKIQILNYKFIDMIK
jgi:hypothetical protein